MENLYKYMAYSLLTVTAVGMFLIGYGINRVQEKVTKFGYISTELDGINRVQEKVTKFGYISTELDGINERMESVREKGESLVAYLRRFNEELRLRQIIREELKLSRDLTEKLE